MATNGTPRGPIRVDPATGGLLNDANFANGRARTAGPQQPRVQQSSPRDRDRARREKVTNNKTRTSNRSKTREYHVHINKGGTGDGGAAGQFSRQSPIGDAEFLSAGHIREFAERGRRAMRQAAMDFAYAEQTLRLVLREVPVAPGQGRGQAIARAHRVARSLKRAANAAQAASAHSARTWPAFMREYAPELNAYGGPKQQPRRNMNFGM
ncbi:plasmid transfer protein TraA [Streptomyces sp. NPDC019443]|uniref:plasmid transfer protein TraA n=1 Tax=Streptomyces sp. NPDC019443 TaxID=3365061 RepID=UPI00379E1A31